MANHRTGFNVTNYVYNLLSGSDSSVSSVAKSPKFIMKSEICLLDYELIYSNTLLILGINSKVDMYFAERYVFFGVLLLLF